MLEYHADKLYTMMQPMGRAITKLGKLPKTSSCQEANTMLPLKM